MSERQQVSNYNETERKRAIRKRSERKKKK